MTINLVSLAVQEEELDKLFAPNLCNYRFISYKLHLIFGQTAEISDLKLRQTARHA